MDTTPRRLPWLTLGLAVIASALLAFPEAASALELDRSAYYAPTNFMVYGRYRFEPGNAPLDNRPRPVQTYSSF